MVPGRNEGRRLMRCRCRAAGRLCALVAASALPCVSAAAAADVPALFRGSAVGGERPAEAGSAVPSPWRPRASAERVGQQGEAEWRLRPTARVDDGALVRVREAVRRDGAAELALNLFADVELRAVLERLERTPRGYALSGEIAGDAGSAVTLVENGGIFYGTVHAGGVRYEIRTAGSAQTVERTVPVPWACGGAVAYDADGGTPARAADAPASRSGGPVARAGAGTEDDGSVIDVLVVYTPAARRRLGGHRRMLARIDHHVAWTNNAYALSDAAQRIRLAGAVEMVGYEEADAEKDLVRLAARDGHMDEVHGLRDALAADLVLLQRSAGRGWAYTRNDLDIDDWPSYSVAGVAGDSADVFAHELGHNMGLHHDRKWAFGVSNKPFPYSYGYHFHALWPEDRRWGALAIARP